MADSTIQGNYPDGSPFKFSLDGIATRDQLERLIKLTATMAKRDGKNTPEEKERIDLLERGNKQYKQYNKNIDEVNDGMDSFESSLQKASAVTSLFKGHMFSAIRALDNPMAKLAAGMGGLVAGLMNYADDLRPALQRGIAGGVLDFAVTAKSAGLTLGDFNKALAATGGTFTMLGDGATSGAKNFGTLINSVRGATASVGNLGMSNEQLAEFTAQQLKISVQQGLKGKQAQEAVVKTSKILGDEFDNLANRTGKTIQEMADAAIKLVNDPTVNSFLASLGQGGDKASAAMQSVGANMTALFGKTGEKLANEAAQAAASGLPLTFNEMGRSIAGMAPSLYNEVERQMGRAAKGFTPSEEDRQRMRESALEAERTMGEQLRVYSKSNDAAGQAAREILAMAQEARSYNTDANVEKRKREKAAQDFNTEVNKLSANMNQLMVPFLQLLNGIDWTFMFQVLNGFASTIKILLTPLEWLGKLLGSTGLGTVIGGFLGLLTVGTLLVSGFGLLANGVRGLVGVITTAAKTIGLMNGAMGIGKVGPAAAGVSTATEKSKGIGGLADKEREVAARLAAERDARIARAQEMRKERPDLTAAQAMDRAKQEQLNANQGPQLKRITEADTKIAKVGNTVEKFAGAIAGVTVALTGTAMTIAGEALLREDANSKMGEFLVKWGGVVSTFGTVAGLLLQFAPAISGAISTVTAYMALHGGAIPALTAFIANLWASSKALGTGFLSILGKLGTGLATAGRLLIPMFSALVPILAGAATAIGGFLVAAAPVIAVIAGIAAAGYLLYKSFDFLVAGVKWLANGIWEGMKAVWEGIKTVGGWVLDAGKALASGAKSLWDIMTKPFTALWDWLKGSWLGKKLFGGSEDKKTAETKKTSQDGMTLDQINAAKAALRYGNANDMSDKKTVEPKARDAEPKAKDVDTMRGSVKAQVINPADQDGSLKRGNSGWANMSQTPSTVDENGKRRTATLEEINALKTGLQQSNMVRISEPERQNVNSTLVDTQTSALDQKSIKENENTKQLVTLNKNMESLIESSDANLSVNGKNASINDTNGRYMRNKSLYGTA